MLYNIAISQTHGGVEQYYYAGHNRVSTIVPKVYFQNNKKWYAEIRYNYDELETVSFNAGKTFSKENSLSYAITPIAGLMAGRYNGGSFGLNTELDYKKIFFSAESQYALSFEGREADFFYNWSEIGYQVTDHIYTGLALQLTHLYKATNSWEFGIMTGFSINKWTFPVYIFNPAGNNRYFVLGINLEWGRIKTESRKIEMPLLTNTGK
ncbi:MAG: hypothetical protein ABIN97_19980 [Ginsengibacter sp.]